ncbi:MAG: DNA polymerase III subunit beta [Thermodesulfobacteriota bacterium]|jgi:DNA polymerase-3 subunit beta
MKFKTRAEDFSLKLGLVQGISERRATMPVLSHVLLNVNKNRIGISATDLETTMSTWSPAEVSKPGSIALPARKLYEIVKELETGELEVEEIGNHWVEIRASSAVFKIAGLPSEDFPIIPELHSDNLFSVESALLEEMISKTIFAVSPDELRRNLAGIFFEEAGGKSLRLVATDGHRLSLVEKDIDSRVKFGKGFVVPKKGVAELRKVLKLSDKVRIGVGDNFFMVEGEDIILIARLIDADFPDYRQVTPEVTKATLALDRNEFLKALKRVSILSSEKTRSVKFIINKGGMTLISISPEIGEAKETVPLDYSGDPIELGFNARYLMDVLEVITGERVQIGLIDELSPAVLRPEGDEVYLSVIMPMRV